MTLRTRLTAAFFAMSVIPLSAVTLFSYYSSERALRRAASDQASTMAAELGRRMEWVTSDLERRMEWVWPLPKAPETMASAAMPRRPSDRAPRRPVPAEMTPDMAGHLASVLGDTAPMFESLEILPAPGPPAIVPPPKPPSAPLPPPRQPGRSPREAGAWADTRSAAWAENTKVVVQMGRVIDKAMERYRSEAGTSGQGDVTAWSKAVQERLRQGLAALPTEQQLRELARQAKAAEALADGLEEADGAGAREQGPRTGAGVASEAPTRRSKAAGVGESKAPTRRRIAKGVRETGAAATVLSETDTANPDRMKAITEMKGADVESRLRRDGREVGRIHAKLNMGRVLRTILPTRREQGEVAFAIDSKGEVHASDPDKPVVATLKQAGAIPAGGNASSSKGDWVVVTRQGPGGMTFGTARPLGREMQELRGVAVRNFGVGFALIALVFVGSVPLAAGMTRNLRTLMQGVQAVAHGDLTTRVPVRSRDEFGRLAAAFNQMTADLAAHQDLVVQQERLRRELELCRQIQTDMLPREPLRVGLAEVKGVSIPAREVGGDFFNYFVLPAGDIAVLVADVSGKGVGAALLMANVQATLRARLPLEQDLSQLAQALDRDLYANTPLEVYLTMFVGIVNPATGVLRYVNAGHNTQFVLRRDGGIDRLPSTGRPLGLLPGGPFEERSTPLPLHDLLFFYTDGIVEAENEAGDQFGIDRLEATLRGAAGPGSRVDDVLARIEQEVRSFRGGAEPSDDATMMALRLGGPS